MKHFTEEELLQEIADGNRTIEGLAAKFGLSPVSMTRALVKLGINLKEMRHLAKEESLQDITADKIELSSSSVMGAIDRLRTNLKEGKPEPIIMNDFSASDEDAWHQLYKEYDLEGSIGTQAQFVIAQCRVIDGMTVAQARQYIKDNFHYQTMEIKLNK